MPTFATHVKDSDKIFSGCHEKELMTKVLTERYRILGSRLANISFEEDFSI